MINADKELRERVLSEKRWLESLFTRRITSDEFHEMACSGEVNDDEPIFYEIVDIDDENAPTAADDLINGVYSVRYTIDADGEYLGVKLLLAGGGPTIWFDSFAETLRGSWGFSETEIHVDPATCAAVDEIFAEQWACVR